MSNISRRGILPNVGYKSPVVVATTVNITLSGSQLIGTVTVVNRDRVLVNAQTDDTENGLYDVNAAGTWKRSQDFNDREDAVNGVQVLETEFSVVYRAVFVDPWLPGTTSINWLSGAVLPNGGGSDTEILFNSSGAVSSDPNLTWDGSILDVTGQVLIEATIPRLTFNETDVAVDNRRWDLVLFAEQLRGRLVDDADSSATNWLTVDRTLNVVDLITLAGPTTIAGAFTSIGIDDNATGERMDLDDTALTLGAAGSNYIIDMPGTADILDIFGGLAGASLQLHGSTETDAYDFNLFANGLVINFDESLGELDLFTGIAGSKTLAATFDANQDLLLGGHVRMVEETDVSAPGAGNAKWWVKDDAPNVPMFTDDTDDDQIISYKIDNAVSGLETAQAADAEHDITISVGWCMNSNNTQVMVLKTALTKQIDIATGWVAGNNQAGLADAVTSRSILSQSNCVVVLSMMLTVQQPTG